MEGFQHFRGLQGKQKLLPPILTEEDILSLQREGFCIVEDFVETSRLIRLAIELQKELDWQMNTWSVTHDSPEYGQIRSPFLRSNLVLEIILDSLLVDIFDYLLTGSPIYHLVNGQIVRKTQTHNQCQWHRDLNKVHISDPPLGFNCLLFVGDYIESKSALINESGLREWQYFDVMPRSHQEYDIPDFESNQKKLRLKPGSVLIFNSLLWHRVSMSDGCQMFLNIMSTEPFIKQQINLLGSSREWLASKGGVESKLSRLLGYWSIPPSDIDQFRSPTGGIRSYRAGQG